ncbi:MAG: low molecular weight phosphotyrosine protein phosphatase [Francisellaceae bacterium]|jgi:protein-tyrosine phosphatase|nr:low molecular weight phosphotyrosine protein phosphatase [Francisellaceae bacterium]MBT6207564.1 low molecular weight phosphotyrosine protein phosphatase [Francisellaceae bacterium]MBT6538932.1 low molecular weight phosphotyrosine protein phosphatase [Francisellaceae bacterium]
MPNSLCKILFVCSGNICRSPTAEGVFEHLIVEGGIDDKFMIDSAGTHGYHSGGSPDPRSTSTALEHGIDLSSQKSRKVHEVDFEIFDYIVAMDRSNYVNLLDICPKEYQYKVTMLLEHLKDSELIEVPDPYHFSENGFEDVFNIVYSGCVGLLGKVK